MNKGFTLVEVLVSLLLFSIISGMTFAVLNIGRNAYMVDSSRVHLMSQARNAVDRISREVRGSKSDWITIQGTNHIIFNNAKYPDPTGTQKIEYNLDNNSIYRRDPVTLISSPIAQNISDLTLTHTLGTDFILISVTASQAQVGSTTAMTVTLNEKVRLRNE